MSDLDELYQSVILDHDRSPRNFRELTGEGCRSAEVYTLRRAKYQSTGSESGIICAYGG